MVRDKGAKGKRLEIDTHEFYSLNEAKRALENAPQLEYRDRDHNLYFYEMWPLVRIAEYINKSSNDISQLKFSDGKRNDDGIVVLNGREQEIQFVLSMNGQQERVRMEHLKKYGRAPAVQDMKWQGNKNNRDLPEQDTNAFEANDILEKICSLIDDAVRGKIKSQYTGMWLGVVFEDYIPPLNEKTNQLYMKICERVIEKQVDQIKTIYSKVFFVGTSGNFIKQFDFQII
jgi:hypothetical protein